jgi:hypothetical protein
MGSFLEISVETEGFVEQEAGGQFGFLYVSRKTYFMNERTHILTSVYFRTSLNAFVN